MMKMSGLAGNAQAQANALPGGSWTVGALGDCQTLSPVPQTLASAESGIFEINNFLSDLIKQAEAISEAIGGPRPVEAGEGKSGNAGNPGAGVVARMHDGVGHAFTKVAHLGDILNSIQRALG